ncbi:hypothetical protein J6590_016582 [Homalodisca vitripennis]|nr:hypothetical protein J6590_016582 [Homalodisca vitripennis]
MTEKKPTYAGAKLWNALPEHLRKTEKQQFVRRLKNWLLEHPIYQLKEFYETPYLITSEKLGKGVGKLLKILHDRGSLKSSLCQSTLNDLEESLSAGWCESVTPPSTPHPRALLSMTNVEPCMMACICDTPSPSPTADTARKCRDTAPTPHPSTEIIAIQSLRLHFSSGDSTTLYREFHTNLRWLDGRLSLTSLKKINYCDQNRKL